VHENDTQDRLGENFLNTDRKAICLKPDGVWLAIEKWPVRISTS
jgi:hypothetical protein